LKEGKIFMVDYELLSTVPLEALRDAQHRVRV
jgi:hypothetical protein